MTGTVPNEIDVAEGGAGTLGHHFHFANKQQVGGDVPGDWVGQRTGYHTFGVDWEPGSLTFYWDGKKVPSTPDNPNPLTNATINPSTGKPLGADVIKGEPKYLILSNSPGNKSYALATAGMYVDYVRVWCKGSANSCRK